MTKAKDSSDKLDRRTAVVKHKKNPFLVECVAEIEMGKKILSFGTGHRLVDEETGEVRGEAAFKQVRVVDKSKFLMMYMSMQSSFWQLSQRALKVLRVIFHEVQFNAIGKDEVYLSWEIAEEIFKNESIKCSRATYFRGLGELVDKKVVAESTRGGIFFLNPTLLFNGNRATFIQQIVTDDPNIENEAQELIAKRNLEVHRELTSSQIQKIGDDFRKDLNKRKSKS